LGLVITNNDEQFSKQYEQIDDTDFGISILVREEQFLKLLSSRIVDLDLEVIKYSHLKLSFVLFLFF
jgi:hypothetical protein